MIMNQVHYHNVRKLCSDRTRKYAASCFEGCVRRSFCQEHDYLIQSELGIAAAQSPLISSIAVPCRRAAEYPYAAIIFGRTRWIVAAMPMGTLSPPALGSGMCR
jgi:hypothetical protein